MSTGFYVYEWYIIDTEEVFYVGKGSGRRATSSKSRSELFDKIKHNYQTDYRIVFDNLTEEKSLELEARQMLLRKLEGNHLVNILDEFDDYYFSDLDDAYTAYCDKILAEYELDDIFNASVTNRTFLPTVYIDKISVHYFGTPKDAVFDKIDDDFLEIYLHQRVSALRNKRIQEEVVFIKSNTSKVKVRTKKKAKYIVEFEVPSYNEIMSYRAEGYKVIHSLDLIKHLNHGLPINYKS